VNAEGDRGFWLAVVGQGEPETVVRFEHHSDGHDPDDYLDLGHAPKEKKFDETAAGAQVADNGYEMTTGWQWAGSEWVAVVQWK